jgi:hypothetical protein
LRLDAASLDYLRTGRENVTQFHLATSNDLLLSLDGEVPAEVTVFSTPSQDGKKPTGVPSNPSRDGQETKEALSILSRDGERPVEVSSNPSRDGEVPERTLSASATVGQATTPTTELPTSSVGPRSDRLPDEASHTLLGDVPVVDMLEKRFIPEVDVSAESPLEQVVLGVLEKAELFDAISARIERLEDEHHRLQCEMKSFVADVNKKLVSHFSEVEGKIDANAKSGEKNVDSALAVMNKKLNNCVAECDQKRDFAISDIVDTNQKLKAQLAVLQAKLHQQQSAHEDAVKRMESQIANMKSDLQDQLDAKNREMSSLLGTLKTRCQAEQLVTRLDVSKKHVPTGQCVTGSSQNDKVYTGAAAPTSQNEHTDQKPCNVGTSHPPAVVNAVKTNDPSASGTISISSPDQPFTWKKFIEEELNNRRPYAWDPGFKSSEEEKGLESLLQPQFFQKNSKVADTLPLIMSECWRLFRMTDGSETIWDIGHFLVGETPFCILGSRLHTSESMGLRQRDPSEASTAEVDQAIQACAITPELPWLELRQKIMRLKQTLSPDFFLSVLWDKMNEMAKKFPDHERSHRIQRENEWGQEHADPHLYPGMWVLNVLRSWQKSEYLHQMPSAPNPDPVKPVMDSFCTFEASLKEQLRLGTRAWDEAAANRFVSGIKSLTEGDGVWRRAGDEVLYLCVPGEFGGVGSSPGCQVARLSWKSPSCQLITIMQWQCLPELKKIDWRKDWKKKKGRPGKTKSTM